MSRLSRAITLTTRLNHGKKLKGIASDANAKRILSFLSLACLLVAYSSQLLEASYGHRPNTDSESNSNFAASIVDSFADGSKEKNLTFTGSESQIEYVSLPKASTVLSATLSVTVYAESDKVYENEGCPMDYFLSVPWPTPYIRYVGDSEILVTSMYLWTDPAWVGGNIYVYVTTDPSYLPEIWMPMGPDQPVAPGIDIKFSACYPLENNRMQYNKTSCIITVSTCVPLTKNDYLGVWFDAAFGITNNPIITINDTWTTPSSGFPILGMYAIQCPMSDSYMDVGNSGPPWEWSCLGSFSVPPSSQVASLNATLLNDYLRDSPVNRHKNVSIPLLFHSNSAGSLRISNIRITYVPSVQTSRKDGHYWHGFKGRLCPLWSKERAR